MPRKLPVTLLAALAIGLPSCQNTQPQPNTAFELAIHVPTHPKRLVLSRSDPDFNTATWTVTNLTTQPVTVALVEFKRRSFLQWQEVPHPFQEAPGGEIPPGESSSFSATVRPDAPLGTYRYAIEPRPGVRFNTPEVKIVDPRQ
jgi:hypothetical protein